MNQKSSINIEGDKNGFSTLYMKEIQIAAQYFQNGNIVTAEKLLISAFKKYPKNIDILHMLGLIKIQSKSLIEARQYFEQAIAEDQNNEIALLFNYANLLVELCAYEKAVEYYEKCLRIEQNNPAIWQGLGVALRGTKELTRAFNVFERAIKIDPYNSLCLMNMAGVLSDLGKDADALSILETSLSIKNSSTALKNKAAILSKLNLCEEAEKAITSALILDGNDIDILLFYAEFLLLKKEYPKSEVYFKKTLELDSNNAEAKRGVAIVLAEQGKLNEAHLLASSIVKNQSSNGNDWMTLGIICKYLGSINESVVALERSIELDSSIPEAHYNLGHVYLEGCQFSRGWQEYGYRWHCKEFGSNEFETDKPKWDGVNRNGVLLIWAEQGIGDQILYASFLDLIKDRVHKLIVALDQRLLPIFERSHPSITFISKDAISSNLIFDWHISIGDSVKYVCRSQEDLKRRIFPYIQPNLNFDIDSKFTSQLSQKKKLIGLSWLSINVKHSNAKSLELRQLLPILKINNTHFYDIGYVDSAEERKVVFENNKITVHKINDIDSFNDIDSLTALIATTDFVVTTSNTCAHIAGALGKKTYLLLPRYIGRLWYWHCNNQQSLWYPSISVFKQGEDGDWESAIESIRQKIQDDWV